MLKSLFKRPQKIKTKPYDWRIFSPEELRRQRLLWRSRLLQVMKEVDPEVLFKANKILDAGCAFGALTYELKEMFPDKEVIGVEYNKKRLNVACQLPITTKFAHLNFLPFPDDEFDLIFCLRVWMPSGVKCENVRKDKEPSTPYFWAFQKTRLNDLSRVLKTGGILILEVWSDVPPNALLTHNFDSYSLRVLHFQPGDSHAGRDSVITLMKY